MTLYIDGHFIDCQKTSIFPFIDIG